MGLNSMETCFIESNTRQCRIDQSFSFAEIDPKSLADLKEVGRCEFAIPENYFDLIYPGQYRRCIQAVRLTIVCVTGPHTNIGAKLTLLRSYMRKEATLDAAHLAEVPMSRAPSATTSTVHEDAGVFELSFHDEKYRPFVGAGAISEWRLELPPQLQTFDYQSITDVVLNISYTAEENSE